MKENIPLMKIVTHLPAKAVPLFLEGNIKIPLKKGGIKRGMFC